MKPTIYLRFPFNRNGFEDPATPATALSDKQLSDFISKLVSQAPIDWHKTALSYHVSVVHLLQLACHLYDKKGKGLNDETQRRNWVDKLAHASLPETRDVNAVNMASRDHSNSTTSANSHSNSSVPSLIKSREKSLVISPTDDAVFASVDHMSNPHVEISHATSGTATTNTDPHLFSSTDLEGVSASALEEAILSALND
ncbi:hypothetical protein B0I72DRAFT_137772 [Yarrowia lipolytica]|jgi:hypothetical protein|uniref:Autophagy-related protein 29 n=2 Tax=Yarrowia lipolytica TaxID=4952 RepID=Q6CCR2_YARLI|nr:YALI0C07282p [Yarrowia lipolytica CLIB122]QNP96475.1 Hypothetical protein YALI2_C00128g [Yarrowia lipolytica]RDW27199.1 hypothetical protein B0I71DRAFT_129655 [Yarrowia lipolytica]RDW32580.1 hypothetical protein B0I72DRAFT_137772 [Yarrowia lipolytica]RDW36228.1 hypothetical protein B0I73DRAFT_137449 [Yarrowia lipolytica]RDW48161.1 hypothetical protein B0I74DRAFT_134061 [Yarrowia lipolytica]|eukprot:XP_501550.1 YALI0C07282p [Yarrowia lipolytica CLIB122]